MVAAFHFSGHSEETERFTRPRLRSILAPVNTSRKSDASQSHRRPHHSQKSDSRVTGSASADKNFGLVRNAGLSCDIILNGKPHLAMADNQASANIMSLEFARQERITVEESVPVPFILGNGSIDYSVGRATADCALRSAPHFSGIREFYVFSTSSEPLILGRAFLLETGLTKCPQNLIRCTTIKGGLSAPLTSPLSRIERSRWQIKAVVKHASVTHQTSVVPDKGSDFDIMSLAYAQMINAGMTPCQRDQDIVLLANGRVARVMGSAKVSIHFIGKANRLGPIPVRFVIIENLPFHIALGNPFLEKYRVFDRVSEFQWTHTTDDNALLCSCLRFSGSKSITGERIMSTHSPEAIQRSSAYWLIEQPKEPTSEIQNTTDRLVLLREDGYRRGNTQQNLFANNQEIPADAEIHAGRANINNQEAPADAEIYAGRANTNNQEAPADAEIHAGRANTNNQEIPADAEIYAGRANTNNQETPADAEIHAGRANTNNQEIPADAEIYAGRANTNNQETPANTEIYAGRANTNNQETPANAEIYTGRENTNVQANLTVTGSRTNGANANNQEGETASGWRKSLMAMAQEGRMKVTVKIRGLLKKGQAPG